MCRYTTLVERGGDNRLAARVFHKRIDLFARVLNKVRAARVYAVRFAEIDGVNECEIG